MLALHHSHSPARPTSFCTPRISLLERQKRPSALICCVLSGARSIGLIPKLFPPHPPAATHMNPSRPSTSQASSYTFLPESPDPRSNDDPIAQVVQGTNALTVNGSLAHPVASDQSAVPPKKPKMTSRLTRIDRKSTRLNSSHSGETRMPSSA